MKFLIFISLLVAVAILNIGYYDEVSDGEINTIYFIKKIPTPRMEFHNIHANDGEYRAVETLSNEYRQYIIDYCKYRLGIDTELTTQTDVNICAQR